MNINQYKKLVTRTSPKRQQPERLECFALVDWLVLNRIMHFHVKNENTVRNPAYYGLMKKLGVNPGFPDYVIPIEGIALIFIEMKIKPRKPSKEQQEVLDVLKTFPKTYSKCCYSADEAIDFIQNIRGN